MKISESPHKESNKGSGVTLNLVFAVAASAVGSAFQHGYNTGVVNAPQKLVAQFINATYAERFQEFPDQPTIDLIYSIMVSTFCVGGMIGALCTAYVSEKFGRKGGLLWNNCLVFLAAALMGSCRAAQSYELLIMGRFFIGINAGLNAGLTPMYLSEISPISLKGAIGTIYQLVIVISILISVLLGFPSVWGTEQLWPYMFALPILPACLMLALLPICPESPKHILIVEGKEVQAQRALSWLRGTLEVHEEMDEMRAEYEALKLVPRVSLHEMWYNPTLRQPLIIAVMIMLSQQFSGINAVIFFSTDIFTSAGLTEEAALHASLILTAINVIMTLVSLVLVDRAGRRTLHMIGLFGMMITTTILAVCMALQKILPALSYLAVLAVYFFIIMFASGPGSIPWFLVAELFGAGARPIATSLAVSVNWTANFVVGLTFLPMTNLLGGYTFLVFSALLGLFGTFTYYKVPETKGKSSEEIAAYFRQQVYTSS